MTTSKVCRLLLALFCALGWSAAIAQAVKITPLGSHAGEFCDRAAGMCRGIAR